MYIDNKLFKMNFTNEEKHQIVSGLSLRVTALALLDINIKSGIIALIRQTYTYFS